MDWWLKLKDLVLGRSEADAARAPERKEPRLPSYVMALCTVSGESAFSVEITGLSVSGLKLSTPRRLATNVDMMLRVPVGLNFQHRDTNEYISFKVRTVWSRRGATGFEAGVRYADESNARRDRWITLVLETYGISLGDDRRTRGTRYPVRLTARMHSVDGREATGAVRNISLGGIQISVNGPRFDDGLHVTLELQGTRGTLSLAASILHTRNEPGKTSRLYGLAFDDPSEPQREALVNTVTALSRQVVDRQGGTPSGDNPTTHPSQT